MSRYMSNYMAGVKSHPTPVQVEKVIEICLDRLYQLLRTVMPAAKAIVTLYEAVNTDVRPRATDQSDKAQLIADQADAAVDLWYYCLNAFAKIGVNLDEALGELACDHGKQVQEFTSLSLGVTPVYRPDGLNRDEVVFVVRMMCSELVELAQTVMSESDAAIRLVRAAVAEIYIEDGSPMLEDCLEEQSAIVTNMWRECLRPYTLCGINLDRIFNVVHEANMAKRFPDGTFHKRADGKIIKPDGWREPDIKGAIMQQIDHGSW